MNATEASRVAWSTWVDTVARMMRSDHLTLDGLKALRHELRPGGRWAIGTVPTSHRDQHPIVLDQVAKAIIAASDPSMRPTLSTHYTTAGDLMPPASTLPGAS